MLVIVKLNIEDSPVLNLVDPSTFQVISLVESTSMVTVSFMDTESPLSVTLNSGSESGSAVDGIIIVHVNGLTSPFETEPIDVQSPNRLLSSCRVVTGFQVLSSVFSTSHV